MLEILSENKNYVCLKSPYDYDEVQPLAPRLLAYQLMNRKGPTGSNTTEK